MPRTHHLAIDPARPLAQQPQTGHNRWHEDIPPALEVGPGDTVILETRDAFDGQLSPASTRDDVGALDLGPVHPLTGPVYVQGAQPGDLLEVKLLDVDPDPFGSWGYSLFTKPRSVSSGSSHTKISRGSNAVTMKLGTSTTWLMRRSTATLHRA